MFHLIAKPVGVVVYINLCAALHLTLHIIPWSLSLITLSIWSYDTHGITHKWQPLIIYSVLAKRNMMWVNELRNKKSRYYTDIKKRKKSRFDNEAKWQ